MNAMLLADGADSAMNSPRIPVAGGGPSGSHCARALLPNPDARGTVPKAPTYAGRSDTFPPRSGSGGFRLPQGDLHDAVLGDRPAGETDRPVHFVAGSRVDRYVATAVEGTAHWYPDHPSRWQVRTQGAGR